MNPQSYLDQKKEDMIKTYHDLHKLAEPSWQEEKTAKYLRERLSDAGIEIKSFENHFGFIAEIKGHEDTVVALRADMDALLQEVDGVVIANHSCGHDAHSTMVLFAALAISASGIKPKHTIRFIFQPAEEKGEGALQMMEDGALNNVISLFGVHLRPESEVPFQKASPVIIHGSAETIKGTIRGVQAHASRPQDGINAIEVATDIVTKLKKLNLNTDIPHSIKMTQIQTENEASNTIPETVKFSLDVRAQTNDIMNQLNARTIEIFEETMDETKAKILWSMEEFVPAAVQNESAIKITEEAIASIIGKENVVPVCISNGGEDFHFYTSKNPQIAATMVGLGCGLSPGLHHPHMSFNKEALHYGTKILTQTVLLASEQEKLRGELYAKQTESI
ncbi:amidohydrolase [Bacillus sp. AFS041924]|uniref:amidohydrolase n=1 Tax=Bacillus sp. AFS041924 TaxID=2033503 RepID=UPI000BFB29D6|nr:amidohydrolase [Bacillus sp. AFS041924]PGS50373.1 amidohydrolase [Bacillus sp. AFS041924]